MAGIKLLWDLDSTEYFEKNDVTGFFFRCKKFILFWKLCSLQLFKLALEIFKCCLKNVPGMHSFPFSSECSLCGCIQKNHLKATESEKESCPVPSEGCL